MKNRFLFLIFAVALLFSFSFAFGCGNIEPENKDEEKYTVTFFFFEGSPDNRTVRVSYGDTVSLPSPTVDRENFEFVGWTIDGERIDADAETGFIYNFLVDKTLVALYSPVENKDEEEYTVTFELAYGNGRSYLEDESAPLSVTVKKGETLGDQLPELKPRDPSDEYEFVGWFYKDDSNEETEITAETVFSDMNVQSFSIVVYAKLKKVWAGPY